MYSMCMVYLLLNNMSKTIFLNGHKNIDFQIDEKRHI